MECMKENKKRFFRKGGQSHKIQRSFDNHTGNNSYCRGPAQSPSIDSMSGTITPTGVPPMIPLQQIQQHHQQHFQQKQHQQQQKHPHHIQKHQNQMGNRITSNPCLPSSANLCNVPGSITNGHGSCNGTSNNSIHSNSSNIVAAISNSGSIPGPVLASTSGKNTRPSGSHSTNSASLDEAEINMNCHRRFMPAPRRARSAERFDGMRVAYTGAGSGELPLRQVTGEDVLSRSYRSPQILRTVENNIMSNNAGTAVNGSIVGSSRRGGTAASVTKSSTEGFPSPPPSYTTAVNDSRDPPSYHQVIAGMKQPNTLRTHGKPLNNRYANPSSLGPQNQSHSLTSTPTGGIRSVASTPIFASVDHSCGCHKCLMAERLNDPSGNGTDNDAVYMESQAFLMHEIMTDGMAFCSIM